MFDLHSVTVDQLPYMTHELLKEIGIWKVGDRIKILNPTDQSPNVGKGSSLLKCINESVEHLKSSINYVPSVAIILGSGMGCIADNVKNAITIPFKDIPHFKSTTAKSHAGVLVVGQLSGVNVVIMKGRLHYYEGYSTSETIYPIQVFKVWGVNRLFASNACGSLKEKIHPGDFVFVDSHINFLPNPLVGPNVETLGPRWPHGKAPYNSEMNDLALEIASKNSIRSHRGVYMAISGPSGSTHAELKAWEILGADVIGYSTTPEVIAAMHLGINTVAASLVVDFVIPYKSSEVPEAECLRVANEAAPKLGIILEHILPQWK
eukprot:TRINITY_DN8878_c0_g1_i1.p1 TRINITY_DN8878_c0_g1~~TRINITY_DN8878_c0_g1_i1.p1  ORF type:complete len:344 (-),score=15.24 TRINITY_DN8878_c0_g1_i1:162-1121(-)